MINHTAAEDTLLLAQVGPGTPMGEAPRPARDARRHWHYHWVNDEQRVTLLPKAN